MTDYKKKSLKYGATIYAAIIVIALIVASFVYSLIMSQPEDIDDYVVETSNDDVNGINPGADSFPSSAPNVTPPTTPPGSN